MQSVLPMQSNYENKFRDNFTNDATAYAYRNNDK